MNSGALSHVVVHDSDPMASDVDQVPFDGVCTYDVAVVVVCPIGKALPVPAIIVNQSGVEQLIT